MKRKHEAKNDLFYAFVLLVMVVVVVVLNVAAEYFYRASEAYFSQADEAAAPRTAEAAGQGDSSHALSPPGRECCSIAANRTSHRPRLGARMGRIQCERLCQRARPLSQGC
jgi:hypothetical protein